MNQQPITGQNLDREGYPVKEIFETIQGEGPWQGYPAVFIRLGGCNLRCSWCDTNYTDGIEILPEKSIVLRANNLCMREKLERVVITGGEPFIHNLVPLVRMLLDQGTQVQIETNGTLSNPDFPWDEVMIVCSPKAGKIHADIQHNANAYKYVIDTEIDYKDMLPKGSTQEKGKRGPPRPDQLIPEMIWVMPRDGDSERHQKAHEQLAMDACYIMGYRFSGRLHKILGIA